MGIPGTRITGEFTMAALALALFVMLFVFGEQFIGGMTGPNVQMALFAAFLFGIICGWQTNR